MRCSSRCVGAPKGFGENPAVSHRSPNNSDVSYTPATRGGVAEWFKAAVLKTAVLQGTVGSNPTPSASLIRGGRLFSVRENPARAPDVESRTVPSFDG